MSNRIGFSDHQTSTAFDTGFEALQSTAEFQGPVESLSGHGDTDHFALVYEDRTEQFTTVVPFIRQGLERGERCLYIVDDNSQDEVVAVLRDVGIDVDAALDAGQLSIHSAEETYLRGGEFDVDHARNFLQNAMEEALAEYEGFRVTAEETWLTNDEAAQTEFMTCEAHVNDLLEDEAGMALCQYNRAELPPEVIADAITTHPYLIYDDTACPNDYYTPPEEYFGPDNPARNNDRKLATLVDRTEARAALQTNEQYERALHEITAAPDRSFEEKLDALFALGCERFDLDLGGLAMVDREADRLEVEHVNGDHESYEPGLELSLSETFCATAVDSDGQVRIVDAEAAGYADRRDFSDRGFETYLGTILDVEDGRDWAFFFMSEESRDEGFSDAERTFFDLMGQWVEYELERRQRERELRERTERLRAVVETAPDCIKTIGPDGTLLQMNPAGLDLAGVDSASAVIGDCIYDWVAPEHREQYREFNERICRGKYGTLEFDVIGVDGTRRHLESHAAPLHRPDGTTVQVAVTRDITEQKEREQELERYERLAENLPVGVYRNTPGPDGEFVEINDTLAAIFDADSKAELLEYNVSDLYPNPEDRIEFSRRLEREGIVEDVELQQVTLEGEQIWISVTAMKTEEDGEVFFDGIVQDITERKRAQQQLEEERDMFAEGPAIVFRWKPDEDAGWPVEYVSENVEDVLGYTPAELESGEVPYTDLLLDEEIGRIASEVEQHSDETTERFSHDPYRVKTKDGDIRWVKDTTKIIRDETGEITHYLGYLVDITEREEREQQLQQQNDRLESFASLLAHELRNPVTIGQIYSQQLRDDPDDETVDYVTEAFDRIEDIIDVMLILTRGRDAIGERTRVDLARVARKAWDSVETPDAVLDIELDQTIQTDETYIHHLFRNLLENAVEHGGEDVTVTVGELEDGFYVADDGRGIPADQRDAIFDEGYTTAADNGGSGLGLAFVQKLAEVYEWECTVTESESGGARFEFRNIT